MISWTRRRVEMAAIRRKGSSRRRLRPIGAIEALEARQLLNANLLTDLNQSAASPQALLAIGSNRYFTAVDATSTQLFRTVGGGAPQLLASFPAPGSTPSVELASAVVAGSRAYFIADDGTHGREPWMIDDATGTARMLRDVNPGALSGVPSVAGSSFRTLGSSLYFVADGGGGNFELWTSDGTTTSLVADLNPAGSSNPSNLTPFGNRLYFTAADASGRRLYRTNATGTGVELIGGTSPADLTVAGDVLYFTAGSTPALFRVDAAGTGIEALAAASEIGEPQSLVAAGDVLAFLGVAPGGALKLGISRGTPATTSLIDQNSQPAGATRGPLVGVGSDVVQVLVHPTEGTDLWVYHTATGTSEKLLDLFDQAADLDRLSFTRLVTASRLYFVAIDPADGRLALGATDGTIAGSAKLGAIQPGGGPNQLTSLGLWAGVGGRLYFANRDAAGTELWTSDGTLAGTQRVRDIRAGAASSLPRRMVVQGAGIAFVAGSATGDNQIWTSAGTQATTQLATTLTQGGVPTGQTASSLPDPSSPHLAVELGGSVVFFADDGAVGREPWITDGTLAGTRLLADLNPAGSSAPFWLTTFNGSAYTLVRLTGDLGQLWRLNGGANPSAQEVGTVPLTAVRSQPVALGGRLYFGIEDASRYSLVSSTGQPGSGIQTVATFTRGVGAAFSLSQLAVSGSLLYFLTDDSVDGRRLWSSDGTTTTPLRAFPRLAAPTEIAALGTKLFFRASDASAGIELWSYDTADGSAALHADVNPGTGHSLPSDFRVVGSTLYFSAETPATGREVWRTDGTRGTLAAVTESLRPGAAGSVPGTMNAVVAGGRLYVVANDGSRGDELFIADPVSGATQLVDINPTPGVGGLSSSSTRFVVLGDDVYFNANNGTTGSELWISGSSGTRLLSDVVPGPTGSTPQALGRTGGGSLVLAATHPVVGRELFVIAPQPANNPPTLAPIANQTAVEGQELVVPLSASDPDAGQTVSLTLVAGAQFGAAIVGNAFRWTPNFAQGGLTYNFTVRATDSAVPAASVERSFSVTVSETNRPPTIAPIGNLSWQLNQVLTFNASALASDPDAGQSLVYSIVSPPVMGTQPTIDPLSGAFAWTPSVPQLATLTIRVTDSGNPALSADATFQVLVTPPPAVLLGGALVRVGRALTGIQLRFSGPLTPATAQSLRNFRLVSAGRDRRLGTRDDRVEALRRAVYDPSTNTVTLTAAKAFSRTVLYRLTVSNLLDDQSRPVSGRLTIQRNQVRPG